METLDLIRARRSIRRFLDEPVPPAALHRILEAGRHAPSGANRQPWRFVVVDDADAKAEIRRHCEEADRRWHRNAPGWLKAFFDRQEIGTDKEFLTTAPHLICVFAERGNPYWRESAWIAIGFMALQATAEGLGTVTYTPGQTRYLNRILSIPPEFLPVCILPVGRPAESPTSDLRPRRPLEETAWRADGFRRVEVGTASAEQPASYGRRGDSNLPSLMDSRDLVLALLELHRAAADAPGAETLGRDALRILGGILQFDAASILLPSGECIRTGPSELGADVRREDATGEAAALRVGLAVADRKQGELELRRSPGSTFTEPEQELVEEFGVALALALEHARLRGVAP